jgi:transcriptional repressor NrdR
MRCPFCQTSDSRVVDSREADAGAAIRRRRSCSACGRRFTTLEEATLLVVKRSGATEPFAREKVVSGVRKACQGRPVEEDALALLAQRVEEAVRAAGRAEVSSDDVGRAILGPLRELDEVAYLRFASVYRAFDSLEDFEQEIAALRRDHLSETPLTSGGPGSPGAPAAGASAATQASPSNPDAVSLAEGSRSASAHPPPPALAAVAVT